MDSDDEQTITVTATRMNAVTISRPKHTLSYYLHAHTQTPHTTSSAAPNQQHISPTPGSPTLLLPEPGPSRSAVILWGLTMAILLIILIGYVIFTMYLFAIAIPVRRAQLHERARRAALAAKDSISGDQNVKCEVVIIDTRERRKKVSASLLGLSGEISSTARSRKREIEEGYEMSDLSQRSCGGEERGGKSDKEERTVASRHVHWYDPLWNVNVKARDIRDEVAASQTWTGLQISGHIDDVDDDARIAALAQMRHMQLPTQTDLGDDNVWSPVTTTDDLRERLKRRRELGKMKATY